MPTPRPWRTRPGPARVAIPLLLLLACGAPARGAPTPAALAAVHDVRWRIAAATTLGMAPERLGLQALDADASPLALTFGERGLRVRLTPRSLRAPGFRVLVQRTGGALAEVPAPPCATFRGIVEGQPGARVSAARVAGEWRLTAALPGADGGVETWTATPLRELVPGAPAGVAVVARLADLPASGGTCGLADASGPRAEPDPAALERAQSLWPLQCRRIELACDADSEFYGLNGKSVDNTIADIEAVLAGAADIYERDLQATITVGTIVVRTVEPDPYTATNASTLLSQFRTEWTTNQAAVPRDVAQLFTGKDLDGTTVGLAYQSTLCYSSQGYSLVQSRFSSVLANRIENSAHELAHNVGIDHCDYYDFNCRIMCSSIGNCSGGILSFGPAETTYLRSYLAGWGCLDTVSVDVAHADLPLTDAFPGTAPDASKWTAVDRGYVQYGRLSLDHSKGFGTAVYLGTARTLPIVLTGLPTISYKAQSSYVTSGQQLWTEYFDTQRRKWIALAKINSTGGAPPGYTTYTHALGDSALGDQFALRFTAYGSTGTSGAQWYLDDVSITSTAGVPPPAHAGAFALAAHPSPFAGSTALGFTLASPHRARVAVYDARGALVRALLDEERPAGPNACAWDGCGADGRPVAPGVYVVRLQSGGEAAAVRVVRLR